MDIYGVGQKSRDICDLLQTVIYLIEWSMSTQNKDREVLVTCTLSLSRLRPDQQLEAKLNAPAAQQRLFLSSIQPSRSYLLDNVLIPPSIDPAAPQ
jgi:hypothetical protein